MFNETDNEYRAFKDIDLGKPIELDFSRCKYLGEVHSILKEKFGFPEYYGENWDALWDCLDGLFYKRGAVAVRILGFHSMEKGLQEYCEPMLKVFDDIHDSTPNIVFEFVS